VSNRISSRAPLAVAERHVEAQCVRREQRRRFVAQDHGPRLQRRPQFLCQTLARSANLIDRVGVLKCYSARAAQRRRSRMTTSGASYRSTPRESLPVLNSASWRRTHVSEVRRRARTPRDSLLLGGSDNFNMTWIVAADPRRSRRTGSASHLLRTVQRHHSAAAWNGASLRRCVAVL
jgi:hypothetical protein